jgi:aspartyl aminopeptidase
MEADELKQKKDELFDSKRIGWDIASEEEKKAIFEYNKGYIDFISKSKTEREIVKNSLEIAKANGFKNLDEVDEVKPGDKIYFVNRGKNLFLAVIGSENIERGLNIIGAHADSPRLDLKPNPLYEDNGLAFFKTHYYGGIKKYQWTTIPLSIHGVIAKTNGEVVDVNIGEDDSDPIFTITDLLPHLAREQMTKKASEVVEGEALNLLIGSIPFNGEGSDRIKLNIMNLLNQKYGIVERDFLSAELELVPAFKARSLGFDESLVAAYGQDDKVSVYTSLTAMLKVENPIKTAVTIFADKEEIGSMGNTGMESNVFPTFISELLNKMGVNRPNLLDKVFCNSKMLSADVDAGVDPSYAGVSELNNASFLGRGVGICKYTGSGGKYNGSDANAEFLGYIRGMFESNDVVYQVSELGKIDVGGGGTIAYILANKGVEVLDCGVPVLSMHAPYEVTSKYDVYQAAKAYEVFLKSL